MSCVVLRQPEKRPKDLHSPASLWSSKWKPSKRIAQRVRAMTVSLAEGLIGLGCDVGHGFLMQRPVPIDQAATVPSPFQPPYS